MLLLQRIVLLLIHQTTNALKKIQFMSNINLLHVSAPGCHPRGLFQIKLIDAQHATV